MGRGCRQGREASDTAGKTDGLALLGPASLKTKTQWAVPCLALELVNYRNGSWMWPKQAYASKVVSPSPCHYPAVTKTQENDNKKCRAKKKKSDQRDKEGQGQ